MAEHYVSEQEQVEQLKRWWKDNGRALVAGLVIGVGGLGGYRYWDTTQTARAESASINYEHFLQMTSDGRRDDAEAAGRAIVESYRGTAYSQLSTLLLAKLAVDSGDYDQAKSDLQRLVDESPDGEIASVARSRLARILLAEGNAADAAAMVEAIPPVDGDDRFIELRGDVAAANGDKQTARTMYLKALAQAADLGLERGAIQLKLDNLGADAADGET